MKACLATMRCYFRMGRVITLMLVLFVVARIWNLELSTISTSSVGAAAFAKILDFIGINTIGYLVWESVTPTECDC